MNAKIAEVAVTGENVLNEVERAFVGKRDLLKMIMAAVLAGGYILLEDYPCLGKTLLARSLLRQGPIFTNIVLAGDIDV